MTDNNDDLNPAMKALWDGARGDRSFMADKDQTEFVTEAIADAVSQIVMQTQTIQAVRTGALVTRANVLAIVIKAATDRMRIDDEGLAQEFMENFVVAMRTKHAPESAEHLEAMKAIGVVLHQFGQIERAELMKP
jgi:hypothetical protein